MDGLDAVGTHVMFRQHDITTLPGVEVLALTLTAGDVRGKSMEEGKGEVISTSLYSSSVRTQPSESNYLLLYII